MNISVIKFDTELEQLDLVPIIEESGGGPFSLFIGRSEECHIVLDDRKLSRETAELGFDGTRWFVKSLSSSCPVVKLGQPVDKLG